MIEDPEVLGHDHYRVYFMHKELGTRHHVDVVVAFYTMQPHLSGGESQAKRYALDVVDSWGRIGIDPHRLILVGVAHQRWIIARPSSL